MLRRYCINQRRNDGGGRRCIFMNLFSSLSFFLSFFLLLFSSILGMAVRESQPPEKEGIIGKSYSEIIKREGLGKQERGTNTCIQNAV